MGHLNTAVVMAAKDNGKFSDLTNHGVGGYVVIVVGVVLIVGLFVGIARLTRGRNNKG